jgi:ABC-type multidrug transport system permease subunit
LRFVDDLAGAIFDIFKFILRSISYLLAGMIIVAVPMYMIAWLFGLFQ